MKEAGRVWVEIASWAAIRDSLTDHAIAADSADGPYDAQGSSTTLPMVLRSSMA
jgi:hypothetical protein